MKPKDPGRSVERSTQDRVLDRTAREESWLARLRRHRWFTKGRPKPGNRAAEDPGRPER
jgi:hypothetical protein